MRNKILSIIFLLLLIVSNSEGQTQRQIAARKILSVYTKTFENRKGENISKMSLTHYDKKGHVLEVVEFNKDSVKISHETYSYNRNGDEITHKIFDPISNVLKKEIQTEYDRWNRAIKEIVMNGESAIQEFATFTYNTLDDKLSETLHDPNGKMMRLTEFNYDKKGMLVSRRIFNAHGEMTYEKINAYTY